MSKSNPIMSSKLARDIVALGRRYSKAGFPNPNREGCPDRSILRAIAYRDPGLTLKDLPASHIVSCSPCFQEYRQFRRKACVFHGLRITAVSLGTAVILFAAVRFVWDHSGSRIRPHISEKQLATRGPGSVPLSWKVDLASFSPPRGDANTDTTKKIHLPRKLLRVQFFLPLGMEPGKYEIRLQNSTGAILIHESAVGRMEEGTTSVEADIDLTSVARGSFTLMIRPPGLDWRRFPGEVD